MTVYLDSSALLKAFVREPGRDSVLALLASDTVTATSRVAYVECRAALARARRERRLSPRREAVAARALDERWGQLVVVELDESAMRRAGELAAEHRLRAGDAIHLASAETAADGQIGELPFACWDRRLWDAASSLGFAVVPATAP